MGAPGWWLVLCLLLAAADAKKPKTDPTEVEALNTIMRQWGLAASASWNLSGEPCSGAAVDSTDFDDANYNPAIKCDCSYNDNTTCHITQLKVYALNVIGSIPEALQNLTFLFNLDLGQNYLTGPLPAFIGNLTSLQYLSMGINALLGPIPKELGKLQNLLALGIGTNNFSGSLPHEFGNLTNLEQLYIDSSGISGELPSALSNLKRLKILWASDNNFTGKIPDYIGSWRNITDLRFQGNSFQAPIPSSLSNLSNLIDLRIGDLISGSSSLTFINNMTSLIILILRNCRIADVIPSNFDTFKNLEKLDLSFNNITGELPQSLFNLSSVSYLFLGNNSLFGSLPAQKSASLLNIDLSYNQLSGSFPSWVSQENLQLNLVANNFMVGDSNKSILPEGLRCLQRNIPCYRGSPIYSSFAIKCGGNKSIIAGAMYDVDNATLGAASYYVTDPIKWGVSNVGSFADSSVNSTIDSYPGETQNSLNSAVLSELFNTARLSPSSLRYYGFGLQNGNYTIKLQFVENVYSNGSTWQSLGRRNFDIYIQGDLKAKDFDIKKEAGGSPFVAVEKDFLAPVTDNFLEIHFFWAGKGTCCVPYQGMYGPSISAISVSPFDFIPTVSPPSVATAPDKMSNTKSKNKTGFVGGIVACIAALGLLTVLGVLIWRHRRRRPGMDDEELLGIVGGPCIFSYSELRSATEGFSSNNILGGGGFGPVYKGKLQDGRIAAIKQLSVTSQQGKHQFVAEIATISAVQHRNLVKLYGCCVEGNKPLLVYEYLENKSLDQAIFGKNSLNLDWSTRFQICLGVARGLAYLHEESSMRIVHRDIKASNILLDADLTPKISDFGLAKFYDDKKTHMSTIIAGTIGYLAPEYALRGHLTEKADVFAFGVVTLEIVSGKPNSARANEEDEVYLLEWAWRLYENQHAPEMLDPRLTSFDMEEVSRVIGVALLCTQRSPLQRPPMSRVVSMLTGDAEVSKVTSRPGYLYEWQIADISSSFKAENLGGSSIWPSETSQGSAAPSLRAAIHLEGMSSPSQPLVRPVLAE